LADSQPVRKLLNMVLLLAIKDHASDIHFEPFEDEFRIRIKADGVLFEMVPPPRHLAFAITTRIKVMANLDIAERRLPQDGRIELSVGGHPVDLRVSVLPTMFGESVVMRILDRSVVSLDLNKVGMDQPTLKKFRDVIQKPNGIVLVTGPTGSGKTTTLYSALSELNDLADKLITTEDPVEYDIDGIVQIPIDSEIGVTFAACLRAILRQDPDIILVGEIRDVETAEIAVQASLTGHLVFSTLHTNDAPNTVTRLKDMGVPTFLITATVEAILAQRLVRRICPQCREQIEPSEEVVTQFRISGYEPDGKPFFRGRGCEHCNNTGYKGRVGLFELMIIDDDLRDMIMANASVDALRDASQTKGMVPLRVAGINFMHQGITTAEEVLAETIVES
jgi:type IV pilus assembly protein PilB